MIKNIFGDFEGIKIFDGDIQLNLENGIKLNSNFNSKLNLDKNLSNKYAKFCHTRSLFDQTLGMKFWQTDAILQKLFKKDYSIEFHIWKSSWIRRFRRFDAYK